MQVTVTESEVAQTMALLGMLKNWEALRELQREYYSGQVCMAVASSKEKHSVEVATCRYTLRPSAKETAVRECEREIGLLVGRRCAELAEEVCTLIHQHMPIPVER